MSDNEINLAEAKWMPLVRPYLEKLFEGHWLPSHDFGHHTRVWLNACALLRVLNSDEGFLPEKLLLACYFHDTGLLNTITSMHGVESRRICEEFLDSLAQKVEFETGSLLKAIEYHDDKVYRKRNELLGNTIYKILVLADDFDAFGALGAYRYSEIYLLRGIHNVEIPELILGNAKARFMNCKQSLNSLNLMLSDEIPNKYKLLNQIFSPDTFKEPPCSLIEWIDKEIVTPRQNPGNILKEASGRKAGNSRVDYFLKNIGKENFEMS